jgi:hypothetical protein
MAAHDLLTGLLLAAACDQGSLHDVQRWLTDVGSREPAQILRTFGFHAAARSLHGRQAGAPETRDGVYETARTAAACLQDPEIMAWVTPPAHPMPRLDVAVFPGSRHTLYLLSKDGAGAAAPLVAALTDQVLRAAVRAPKPAADAWTRCCWPSWTRRRTSQDQRPAAASPHFGSRGSCPDDPAVPPQGAGVWGEQAWPPCGRRPP